jgi:hypothetical protein
MHKRCSRLDGRTESSQRQKLVERFNEPSNKRVKCTLISTRAGSLGINLHAANRVVIVDGSWNPTYDLQAIYRAWRYVQVNFFPYENKFFFWGGGGKHAGKVIIFILDAMLEISFACEKAFYFYQLETEDVYFSYIERGNIHYIYRHTSPHNILVINIKYLNS